MTTRRPAGTRLYNGLGLRERRRMRGAILSASHRRIGERSILVTPDDCSIWDDSWPARWGKS